MSDLINVTKEDGVKDLPLSARANFARALIAEREGRKEDADKFLQAAIDASEK